MRYVYLVMSMLVLFVGCNEEDLLNSILPSVDEPVGTFSSCEDQGSGVYAKAIVVSDSQTKTLSITGHNSSDCSDAAVSTAVDTNIQFSGFDISGGNGVSYFESEDKSIVMPYKLSGNSIVLGLSSNTESEISEEQAASLFADFIEDPEGNAGYTLNKE